MIDLAEVFILKLDPCAHEFLRETQRELNGRTNFYVKFWINVRGLVTQALSGVRTLRAVLSGVQFPSVRKRRVGPGPT
jgi:hypothetical protein